MREVKESEILNEFSVCPYCMSEKRGFVRGCCGESWDHFEKAYLLADDELILASEIKIIPEAGKNETQH